MILSWIGFSALLVVTRCIQIVRGSAQKPTLLFLCLWISNCRNSSNSSHAAKGTPSTSIWHDMMISGETKGYSKAYLPLAKSRLLGRKFGNAVFFCGKCYFPKQQQEKSMPSLPDLLSPLHNCCRSTRVRCRAMASSKARLDGFHKL